MKECDCWDPETRSKVTLSSISVPLAILISATYLGARTIFSALNSSLPPKPVIGFQLMPSKFF